MFSSPLHAEMPQWSEGGLWFLVMFSSQKVTEGRPGGVRGGFPPPFLHSSAPTFPRRQSLTAAWRPLQTCPRGPFRASRPEASAQTRHANQTRHAHQIGGHHGHGEEMACLCGVLVQQCAQEEDAAYLFRVSCPVLLPSLLAQPQFRPDAAPLNFQLLELPRQSPKTALKRSLRLAERKVLGLTLLAEKLVLVGFCL